MLMAMEALRLSILRTSCGVWCGVCVRAHGGWVGWGVCMLGVGGWVGRVGGHAARRPCTTTAPTVAAGTGRTLTCEYE